MTGKFRIDTIESAAYGFVITEGSYDQLVEFPALKKPDTNSWDEENGIEVNLNNPKVESKEISLTFISTTAGHSIDEIVGILSNGANHSFYFYDLNLTKTLRFIGVNQRKGERNKMSQTTLTFSEDNPPIINATPASIIPTDYRYGIEGKMLTDYGIILLEGSMEELMKCPRPKKKLTIESETESGISYPDNILRYEAKDVRLKCLMRTSNIEQFKSNCNALLYELTRPGEKTFYCSEMNTTDNPFYYKNMQVEKFTTYGTGKIWCEFTLTLCFTKFQY